MANVFATVQLHGHTVGALEFDPERQLAGFEYAPSWLATGIQISPIHLPLSEKIYSFRGLNPLTFKGLPPAFADALPDDFGNAVINAWLAREGRSQQSFHALERLLYTGTRGMGALEYLPEQRLFDNRKQPIELNSLVTMAQAVLDQRKALNVPMQQGDEQAALQAILQVGTSAGGARAKAVIGINAQRDQIVSGQVALPAGFEHYLLKFDGVVERHSEQETFGDPKGYGRMEYAYYLMAKDAGIDMSPCELLLEGDRAHFLTKRFDRNHNEKIHYQSLCAMDHCDYRAPGQYSYEQLFALMRALKLPRAQGLELYRRMVFNIVARNHDDHTKNFGFLMTPKGQWRLAPAFDVAFSYKKGSPWVNSHQLTLNGKRDDFTLDDLLVPASTFKKDALHIIEQVQSIVSQWPNYASKAGVFDDFSQYIAAHHRLTF